MHGEPMHAICQINLTELPFRPPRLSDLEFITVFIGPDELPVDAPNGTNWCLRGYSDINQLVPLPNPSTALTVKPFPMRPRILDDDFPCWDDVAFDTPEEIGEDYQDMFPNTPGFKLGGWPTLIQSEIFWAPENKHPFAPEYVFQIDSLVKANWMWGDSGVGYFGRGTVSGRKDEWAIEWQCH